MIRKVETIHFQGVDSSNRQLTIILLELQSASIQVGKYRLISLVPQDMDKIQELINLPCSQANTITLTNNYTN
jgi:hypothetical protein